MAKSRPPGASKTERKRDPQETTTMKSPPQPTTGSAEEAVLPADPAPLNAGEQYDSPTPRAAPAVVPIATPSPNQDSARGTARPAPDGSRTLSASASDQQDSQPPIPAAFAAARLTPVTVVETPVSSPAVSLKHDHATDAIPPSPARQLTETSKPEPSSVGPAPVDRRGDRPVHPGAEFVVAKEAPFKPKTTTGPDTPEPAGLPGEQLRSPEPAAAQISEEEIVRGL